MVTRSAFVFTSLLFASAGLSDDVTDDRELGRFDELDRVMVRQKQDNEIAEPVQVEEAQDFKYTGGSLAVNFRLRLMFV